MPAHPNTRRLIRKLNLDVNFTIIDPVSYFEMLGLLDKCRIVLTDSGGLQKEAYFFKKFCITLRTETEWIELVENNVNKIVNLSKTKLVDAIEYFSGKIFPKNILLYGEGNAGEIIVNNIKNI